MKKSLKFFFLIFSTLVIALAIKFYLDNRFVQTKTDEAGYQILRVALHRDYALGIGKQLIENTLSQMPEKKVKVVYTDKNPQIEITVIDSKTKRYIYNLLRFGAKKIFINTGETAEFGFYRARRDFQDFGMKNKQTALALGYLYSMPERYAYFPQYFWSLPGLFKRYPSEKHVEEVLNELKTLRRENLKKQKDKFCAMIYMDDDRLGVRGRICDACQKIDFVHCLGKFRHNHDLLWANGGQRSGDWVNSKQKYLPEFEFNICAENSNVSGYISEKLIHALTSACIPIYCGSDNRPNPKVFNPQAILFWNPEGGNEAVVERIRQLHSNKAHYKEFIEQPVFLPTAAAYINEVLTDMYQKIEGVIRSVL